MARTISSKTTRRRKNLANIKFWRVARIDSDLDTNSLKANTLCKQKLRICWPKIKDTLRITRQDYMPHGSIQEIIRPVLFIGQLFALMPVLGISSKYAEDLRFRWWSFRCCYALIISICFGICLGFVAAFVMLIRIDFDSLDTLIFFAFMFAISLAFLQLATKWPAVMLHWQLVEAELCELKEQGNRAALAYHIRVIIIVAISSSIVEHLLNALTTFFYVQICPAIPNQPLNSYLYMSFSMFFELVGYNTVWGILVKLITLLATFAWSFIDIYVMALSVALAFSFRQLNEQMQRQAKLPNSVDYWIQCRINFCNLCKLCNVIDDAISLITLLCFSNNLYFICVKIMRSLRKKPSLCHTIYFWYSLAYLVGRTLILSLYTASINDECKRPLKIFRLVPRQFWCTELKRFSQEVHLDEVALTGMKLFRLTRGVVISVAATIVTYELILLQFNQTDQVNYCHTN